MQLVYHVCGLLIPRIAHAQYLYATPINPVDMQAGDLIFFKRKRKDFNIVGHVAMYLGDGMLIESTGLQLQMNKVRVISVEDYFGMPLEKLSQGCEVLGDGEDSELRHAKLFFGTFLSSRDAAVDLRKNFLSLMRGE